MSLNVVPWHTIRRIHRGFRRYFFTIDRPSHPVFVVAGTIEDVERELGRQGFAPNWEFSYRYEGEDLNLADTYWEHVDEHPEIVWWQTHVRGWQLDVDEDVQDRVELTAHFEPEPTEHPRVHIEESAFDLVIGLDRLYHAIQASTLDLLEHPRQEQPE